MSLDNAVLNSQTGTVPVCTTRAVIITKILEFRR